MKAILISIKHRHLENIHSGTKTNELRTKPPKIECPFKVYNFDTVSGGGYGKVVSEWICDSMETYRICMGIPKHLLDTGCVTSNEIMEYADKGNKDLTAMHVSNLIIYEKPKELSEFRKPCKCLNEYEDEVYCDCLNCDDAGDSDYGIVACDRTITRPPQSWCYVEKV